MSTFFSGWALWQKMTFVLACAIVAVVAVAYGKLVWTNRYMKKHQLIDEEQRTQVQELRRSGQLVEGPRDDIPFGVRAIQSGIEIDGIWISNTNTPVPSELDLSIRGSTSGSTSGGESSRSVNFSSGRPSISSYRGPTIPTSSSRTPPFAPRRNGSIFVEHTDNPQFLDPGDNKNYKPRRSSGLREYDARTHDESTLADLESGASHPMLSPHSFPPRSSSMIISGASSVADNELNSATSSDSDETIEFERIDKGKGKARETLPVTNADYFAVSNEVPVYKVDPFQRAQENIFNPRIFQVARKNSWCEETEDDVQYAQALTQDEHIPSPPSASCVHSPFVPGELHENKVVRKVNSGFEVLPAGTFGRSSTIPQLGEADENRARKSEDSTEPRRGRKLKKRRRESGASTHSRVFYHRA